MATTRPYKPTTKRPRAPRQSGSIRWLSPEKGRQFVNEQARKRLGISGEEFLRRLDAGEYQNIPDDPEHGPLIELSMLTDFAR
ncbi:MAG TPA: hypothetical protein VII06_42845 [Chloroflexota bacterium]|jgi:hypothetical protein